MSQRPAGRTCSVLIVDDQLDIRELLGQLIALESGCTVYTAEGGREALELLDTLASPPCLILLDLMMPDMSGHEVTGALARHPAHRSIPVTMMTAAATTIPRTSGGLLRKPFVVEDVLALLQAHCDDGERA